MNTTVKSYSVGIGETICAMITPSGIGGVSVIRISGENAITSVNSIFKGNNILTAAPMTIHHGFIIDSNGDPIDEVLISLFRAPHSYTGEDVIEISCHGNPIIVSDLLGLLYNSGVRLANPGEFTFRAFFNNRIDLSQAVAVANIIQAESHKALISSNHQLRGALKELITNIVTRLVEAISLIELDLDFVEEGIQLTDTSILHESLMVSIESIQNLIETYKSGKLYAHGAKITIIGKPNVGKSSLLNALLDNDRAIVSPIAGTTRDVIESSMLYNGIKFIFSDTAGIRQNTDGIESLGIERTLRQIKNSDIIIAVIDLTSDTIAEDIQQCSILIKKYYSVTHAKVVYVLNKDDVHTLKLKSIENLYEYVNIRRNDENIKNDSNSDVNTLSNNRRHDYSVSCSPHNSILISAMKGNNILELKNMIYNSIIDGQNDIASNIVLTNQRHYDSLMNAKKSLTNAINAIGNVSIEFIASELRQTIDFLGEITGKTTSQEVINAIFANFCIGK